MQAFPPPQGLQGATLILPVVAVGNVAQLAADLLINTLRLDRTARLEDDLLLPCVGGIAYDHVPGLATAMELYQPRGGGGSVAVVQQRAAAAPGTQDAFAQRMAAFVKQSGVKEVLVLGSIEASSRRDAQLVGPQLRCWAPDADGGGSGLLHRCEAAAPGGVPPLEPGLLEEWPLEQRLLPPWPLLRHLCQLGVPCAAILSFSTEGDNLGDAFVMAAAAAAAAGLDEGAASGGEAAAGPAGREWVPPRSWQSVYGASAAVY